MRMLRKLGKLHEFNLNARDGDIGRLEEIYFDDKYWHVRYLVIDTGNWLHGRVTLILPDSIDTVNETENHMELALTREQVENSPPHNPKLPISRHHEQMFFEYYDHEPYWTCNTTMNNDPRTPANIDSRHKGDANPHLHGSHEVRGYTIHARDGAIGQVKDFIIGDPDWDLAYLEVDTRKWLPGKHVLIAPTWISQVAWDKHEVKVDLTRDTIEAAPAYDPNKIISKDYQVALYKHYGMNFELD